MYYKAYKIAPLLLQQMSRFGCLSEQPVDRTPKRPVRHNKACEVAPPVQMDILVADRSNEQ